MVLWSGTITKWLNTKETITMTQHKKESTMVSTTPHQKTPNDWDERRIHMMDPVHDGQRRSLCVRRDG